MIAWAIHAVQESELFDHIVVSTDADEIKLVSEQYMELLCYLLG
jgi:CMP-N-acetylneuraminic acid synthetase